MKVHPLAVLSLPTTFTMLRVLDLEVMGDNIGKIIFTATAITLASAGEHIQTFLNTAAVDPLPYLMPPCHRCPAIHQLILPLTILQGTY